MADSDAEMADSDKDEEALATRCKYMERDFEPGYSSMPFDMRLTLAVEYAAYQLGQINRRLDQLIDAGERKPPGPFKGFRRLNSVNFGFVVRPPRDHRAAI